MNRRHFVAAAAAGGLAGAAAPPSTKNAVLELLKIEMRNGPQNQRQRTTEYLKTALPMLQRAGIGPIGFFTVTIGPGSPYILCVMSFPSLAAMDTIQQKLADDKEYQKALDEFNSPTDLPYVRLESSLLRGFDSFPNIVAPPTDAKRPARLFELRTYESNTGKTLAQKIKMFDEAEIGIFKKCGLLPVFFGQTIVGRNMPNLTYMVAFDDWASREKMWKNFQGDPDWQKLRAKPEFADASIVCNISNTLLSPLPFSPIR